MAAPCRTLLRSAVEGLCYLSTRRLCLRAAHVQSVTNHRSQQSVLHCRALHCSHYPLLSSTKTEPQKAAEAPNTTETASEQKKTEDDEVEEDYGPEYIPKRKAKNPMMIIGYAWIIGLPTGIIGFILAKKQVDKNRLKQLRIRQRMKKANEGEYERERYKPAAGLTD
ncbi:DUF4748 domain-containing protein [Colossoma macropomum]|uniref:DUF4748 domain-containing protein n=1 Tax=Colossoma macropomum TaxID=42526 RepID=UPI001865443E|nr:DUF4748 domain-containing protein [Colossoma macropomum]